MEPTISDATLILLKTRTEIPVIKSMKRFVIKRTAKRRVVAHLKSHTASALGLNTTLGSGWFSFVVR
jgi:hypothetical protein